MSDDRFENEPDVPPAVLDELLAAFGVPPADGSTPATPVIPESSGGATGATGDVSVERHSGATAAADASTRALIVIGDDDGLPDPVYLDEEAEERLRATHGGARSPADAERSTIHIADPDDEVESMSAGIPVATGPTSIDPRMRARRIAVRRTEGRRRLRWVLAAAGVVLVVVAVLAVLGSSMFAIDRVEVDGAVYTDRARLEAVIEELRGTPVLTADTQRAERMLEAIPWVERARVTTDFPSGARIEIRERRPLATYAGSDGQFRVIDIEGQVLDVVAGRPLAYMLITETGPDVAPGGFAGSVYARAAEVVASLTPEIRNLTRSVAVVGQGAEGELTLHLGEDTVAHLGQPDGDLVPTKLAWLHVAVQRAEGELPREIEISADGYTVRR